MSSIVVWAPELEVRAVSSWLVSPFTLWLMKPSEVKCNHYVSTKLLVVDNVAVSVFLAVVIRSINNKLLRCTLWFNDDVVHENWLVRNG